MNYEHMYWWFENAIPKRLCDDIVKYAFTKKKETAITGAYQETGDINKVLDKRNSSVTWLNEPWIYKLILPFVKQANVNAGWNFDWDASEQCQFTTYEPGQYYGWHQDSFSKPSKSNDPTFNNKIRKLSVTLTLSEGTDYVGGDLEMDLRNNDCGRDIHAMHQIRKKGALVVFPSYVWHRVAPVIKGTRYSLVIWNHGYQYR